MLGEQKLFGLREKNQDKKARELNNNRLADASADKSGEKRAASAGMMAAAAPAPAPAKALPAAPAAEARNDNMNHPPAMTETVTVEADTTSVIEAVANSRAQSERRSGSERSAKRITC